MYMIYDQNIKYHEDKFQKMHSGIFGLLTSYTFLKICIIDGLLYLKYLSLDTFYSKSRKSQMD